jgi:hypothetical protein
MRPSTSEQLDVVVRPYFDFFAGRIWLETLELSPILVDSDTAYGERSKVGEEICGSECVGLVYLCLG